ncbi:hypothetical protein BUALT_Bualt02G0112000 [Buddleja alternifolia]|uniref:Isopenicillin N synthase-like Fe(2+) 2OG dioxygenase domain-containing protein n=1 Tax=Buddleja alternifolia TaxID=168488 RepID=A0AAV6Y0X4_9LAMI|nr:hypothetical protein BUALT_Bualt02G0112000 [Buddleja alternifolia]
MDSHAQSNKLPIIEFTEKNLIPGTSSWKSTSDSIRWALESYGCLVVDYDKARLEQGYQPVFGLLEELFGLPMETKMKYTSQFKGFGYDGNHPAMPLYESFGIEDGATLESVERFAKLMWPLGHDKFCETMQSNSKVSLELIHMVMKMVLSSYGLEKYSNSLIESSFYMKRLIRYKSQGENETSIGILPHRDKSFMSIISTNEVKGLQIETPQGEWIEFEPSPSKFILIVGEAFMVRSSNSISPL